jgi:signal transduction histidine kinase
MPKLVPLLMGLGAALVVVTLTATTGDITWASRGAPARAAVDMTTILVAALTAFLLRARALDGGGGRTLTLAFGVGLIGVAEATCSLPLEIVSRVNESTMESIDVLASLLVAGVVAVAALAPARVLDRAGRRTGRAMAGALLALPAGGLAVAVLVPFDGDPAGAAAWHAPVYVAAALLGLVAGSAFAARAVRDGARLEAWAAAALVLFAAANLDAAVIPDVTQQSLTTGDLLHAPVVVILLVGVLREARSQLTPAGRRGIAEERRRIARDLHDGLAQELAFIAAQAPRLAAESNDPAAARMAEAAVSALDESRLAIALLGDQPWEPLGLALTRTAERIATRADAIVVSDVDEAVDVAPEVRMHLLRIVREATTNAVVHGDASEISIVLRGDPNVVLEIADNGVGFGLGRLVGRASSGFGLTSMRERAERAGGQLHVRSAPGRGTIIEVCLF